MHLLQMAFLDGNQPDRLCEPMKKSIEARGGEVHDHISKGCFDGREEVQLLRVCRNGWVIKRCLVVQGFRLVCIA